MLFKPLVVAAAVLLGAVAAQNPVSNITIDPNSVSPTLKASWCNGQINACGILCAGDAPINLCDPTSLNYTCTCSNGTAPDLKDYETTMSDFICQQAYVDCVAAHPNDLAGQTACKTNIQSQCGFLSLSNFTATPTTTSSSSSAPSSTAAPSSTSAPASGTGSGSATAASASATKSGAAVALAVGQSYGLGIFAAGAVAAFGYML